MNSIPAVTHRILNRSSRCLPSRASLCPLSAYALKRHKPVASLLAGAVLCALSIGTPAAASVLNGGFEQGTFTGGVGGSQQVQPGDTALSDWTVSGGAVTWYANGNNLHQIALSAHNGNLAANLADGTSNVVTISQTFNLLPFVESQVSFWVGNYTANNAPAPVNVEVRDGTSNTILLSETAPALLPTFESSDWQRFVFHFLPDGTSNTITFTEGDNNLSYIGLDDVNVTAVTPIPAALPLFGTGLAGLGLLARRRKRKTQAVV